jgi:predicted metal-dependent hydrolase
MSSDDYPVHFDFVDGERAQHAIKLFNAHDWYAAHDAFEELWHESVGDERGLLQGIIQIAVAEHHLCGNNQRGALLLMAEGLNHLESCPLQAVGFDLLSLKAIVRQRLASLQAGQPPVDIPMPQLVQKAPDKD